MIRSGRRRFLVGAAGLLAAPLAVAQAPGTMRRVGWLVAGSPKTHGKLLQAFRDGLKERGWVEGRNITLDLRWAEEQLDRVPALIQELVQRKPDVIITAANNLIVEVKKATSTIPIVMATGADPVEWNLAESLARPGGNLTGLTGFYEATPIKMLELVAALVPRGSRVAALLQANTPYSRSRNRSELERTAKVLELRLEFVEVTSSEEFARAVPTLAKSRPAALIVLPGNLFFALGDSLVKSAEALKIPMIYPFEEMVDAGGLMSYAVNLADSYRRAANYVDRILKGAKPGELPIEQPTRLSLAVNLKTAKAQGIRIPQAILLRADRVIE
jgi:putative ABC transport system substrate-binding protein